MNNLKISFSSKHKIIVLLIFCIVLIIVSLTSICIGTYNIPISSILFCDFSQSDGVVSNNIIWNIRLPRIILACFVGMALGSAGTVYQGIFRNPLIDPYILGVSSGAAFGAALAIIIPNLPGSLQVSAFIFGVVAVTGSYLLARVRGQTPLVTMILAGVVVSSIFSALVAVFQYISTNQQLRSIVFWLMGGLYHADWEDVILVVPWIIVAFAAIWFMSWRLNVLSVGEEEAITLGINVELTKFLYIVFATLITALSVSVTGIIGWIGLMMPHAGRMLIGPDHRFLLPLSALFGAIFLIICDTLARTITTGEIPVGIITSLIGAPFIIYLIRTKRNVFWG